MRTVAIRQGSKLACTAMFVAGIAASVALLGPAAPAVAEEQWGFPSYSCGPALVLTSERSNDDARHTHTYSPIGTRIRNVPLASGTYVWTYYNSGFTSTNSSKIWSIGDISNGSRICEA